MKTPLTTAALEMAGVTKDFRAPLSFPQFIRNGFRRGAATRALDNVSFTLARGKALAVLGPNGAGKTTLLRIIATLLLPDAGSVRVDGRDAAADDLGIRAAVGLAASGERSFYWRLTGGQNLEFFAALYGLSPTKAGGRIRELCELFRITYGDKRFDSYSTGMKRKFELARALLHDPPILLLDEPTRSLDHAAACELRSLVRRLVQNGKTVLYATHDMREAEDLCEAFLILDRGRVRGCGTLRELRDGAGKGASSLEEIYLELVKDG